MKQLICHFIPASFAKNWPKAGPISQKKRTGACLATNQGRLNVEQAINDVKANIEYEKQTRIRNAFLQRAVEQRI